MTGPEHATVPLILAGGRGTRIAGLFPDLPKPAIPVAGRPFLAWILAQLSRAGFPEVVISGGYLFEVLREKILPHIPAGMKVTWIQETQPLGTGGGVFHAVSASGLHPIHWLVINGDSYLGGDWPLQGRHLPKGEAVLVARSVVDTGRYGRLEVVDGELREFREKQDRGPGRINAGIYFLPHIWLNQRVRELPRSMETDLIPGWIRGGKKIRVWETGAPFLDIGTPEDFQKADALFASQGPVT